MHDAGKSSAAIFPCCICAKHGCTSARDPCGRLHVRRGLVGIGHQNAMLLWGACCCSTTTNRASKCYAALERKAALYDKLGEDACERKQTRQV
eukprot:1153814-Pelagomonas_calceolata.AAC.8